VATSRVLGGPESLPCGLLVPAGRRCGPRAQHHGVVYGVAVDGFRHRKAHHLQLRVLSRRVWIPHPWVVPALGDPAGLRCGLLGLVGLRCGRAFVVLGARSVHLQQDRQGFRGFRLFLGSPGLRDFRGPEHQVLGSSDRDDPLVHHDPLLCRLHHPVTHNSTKHWYNFYQYHKK